MPYTFWKFFRSFIADSLTLYNGFTKIFKKYSFKNLIIAPIYSPLLFKALFTIFIPELEAAFFINAAA